MPLIVEDQVLHTLGIQTWLQIDSLQYSRLLSIWPELTDDLRLDLTRKHPGLIWLAYETSLEISRMYEKTYSIRPNQFEQILTALELIRCQLNQLGFQAKLSDADVIWVADTQLLFARLKSQVNHPSYLRLSQFFSKASHACAATGAALYFLHFKLVCQMHRMIDHRIH